MWPLSTPSSTLTELGGLKYEGRIGECQLCEGLMVEIREGVPSWIILDDRDELLLGLGSNLSRPLFR